MLLHLMFLSMLSTCVAAGNVCCAPDKWFAQRFSVGLALTRVEGVNVPFDDAGSSTEYYDATNGRLALISNYSLDNTQGESKVIADHNAGLLYTIDLKKSVCRVQKLTLPFAKFCVTDKFKKEFDFTLGYGSNSLTSTAYSEIDSGIGPAPNSKIDTFVLVSKECIPIQTDLYGDDKYNFLQTTGFSGFGATFDDSVFDVPDYCPKCSQSTKTDTPSFQEIPLMWRRRGHV